MFFYLLVKNFTKNHVLIDYILLVALVYDFSFYPNINIFLSWKRSKNTLFFAVCFALTSFNYTKNACLYNKIHIKFLPASFLFSIISEYLILSVMFL